MGSLVSDQIYEKELIAGIYYRVAFIIYTTTLERMFSADYLIMADNLTTNQYYLMDYSDMISL